MDKEVNERMGKLKESIIWWIQHFWEEETHQKIYKKEHKIRIQWEWGLRGW